MDQGWGSNNLFDELALFILRLANALNFIKIDFLHFSGVLIIVLDLIRKKTHQTHQFLKNMNFDLNKRFKHKKDSNNIYIYIYKHENSTKSLLTNNLGFEFNFIARYCPIDKYSCGNRIFFQNMRNVLKPSVLILAK